MLAITALGLVVAISVLVSQTVPEPFGGSRSLTTPTVLPTSISKEKGSADANLTGTNPNTQLVPQETTETLEQSSVNEELSEVTQLSSVNFTSFRNSTYGIQMQYPSHWE